MTPAGICDLPLTTRQRDILRLLDAGEELVSCHGDHWVGLERTNGRLVMALVRKAAIKLVSGTVGEYEVYLITSIGRDLLKCRDAASN